MTADILRIAVPSPLYQTFDYLLPETLPAGSPQANAVRPGVRVRVPFGRQRQIGVLLELRADSPLARDRLRRADAILDSEPVLDADLLALVQWAQRYYHHPPGEVLTTALPALLRQGAEARPQTETALRLTAAGRQALTDGVLTRAPRQQALAALLSARPAGEAVAAAELRAALAGGAFAAAARALYGKGWVERCRRIVAPAGPDDGTGDDSAIAPGDSVSAPVLNTAQAAAVAATCDAFGAFQAFLLDGVTGSGKTEVYLQVIERALAAGYQALVLVPEIGLTPQLLARFRRRLTTARLAVLHSALSDRERLDAWLLARSGEAGVVIGTRSAIFTPLPRLGAIVIDEEHDSSFKQQEGFRYNARDLALVRARQRGVPVLLGSATPALESLYNVDRDRYRRLSLPERVGNAVEPDLTLLDVRRRPMRAGLSGPLLALMRGHLAAGGQTLLFLNRRGFAPTLICHECGWLCQCRHCDARLTLHMRQRLLRCHHCGAEQPLPTSCPDCGSVDLRALGQGTERIETVLEQQFPDIGIARIDRDSTRRKGSLQRLLDDVHQGNRRILIGTQMLAKGHHFPAVTLVGVVDADQGLFGTDYRASERMAQQILQVAGRAGRAERPGEVVIQTHHPEHPLLQTLASEGYPAFAASALAERRQVQLPPYACQALLRADAAEPEPPQRFLRDAALLDAGRAGALGLELLGPVPAPMERRAGRYRAQLLLQSPRRSALHRFLADWVGRLAGLKSARQVRWSLDVDPIDLL